MEENSAWADELLRRVRASADPRPANGSRVLAGIERRLGIAGAVQLSAGDAPELVRAQGPATSPARLARPLGLGAMFGLATGALGYWWGAHSQPAGGDSAPVALSVPAEAAQATLLVPAPRQLAAPEVTQELAGTPLAAAQPPAPEADRAATEPASNHAARKVAPVVRRRTRTLASSEDAKNGSERVARTGAALTLREAIEQLQRAQTALRRGEALEALELVSQLDQSSPHSLLREERLATRALALCEMGDVSSAREVLLELEGDQAQSIYRARLEAGCGLNADVHKE
jgi:hypothetical protein